MTNLKRGRIENKKWCRNLISAHPEIGASLSTRKFMLDLSGRLANRVQLTTDGFKNYTHAVENAFGWNGTDYSQLVKTYGSELEETSSGGRRYSPMVCTGAVKSPLWESPS
jgi:hypothetical protein